MSKKYPRPGSASDPLTILPRALEGARPGLELAIERSVALVTQPDCPESVRALVRAFLDETEKPLVRMLNAVAAARAHIEVTNG